MILHVVTYSGLLKLQFTRTQLGRIQSIERRAKNIIGLNHMVKFWLLLSRSYINNRALQ